MQKEDTDKLGHTNNVRYLEWLEQISWGHFEASGCTWQVQEALGKAMAITRTELDYLHASYTNDVILIGTWVSKNDKRATCSREFQMIRLHDNKTILNAKMNFACISLKTGRMTRMPDIFSAALEVKLKAFE